MDRSRTIEKVKKNVTKKEIEQALLEERSIDKLHEVFHEFQDFISDSVGIEAMDKAD
jgi:hypothetical protein